MLTIIIVDDGRAHNVGDFVGCVRWGLDQRLVLIGICLEADYGREKRFKFILQRKKLKV